MLQNIRDRFTGPTALIVLGLIAIPFIFVGVSSPLIGSGYAAKVNGEEISLGRFEQAWQNQVAQNPEMLNYPPVYQNLIRQQLLDQMIQERLVAEYLNDAGLRVGDRMVTDTVQRLPQFQVDGRFSLEEYRSALTLQGRTTEEYEAAIKEQLRQFQLQQAIAGTAFVTPSEYRRYLNLYAEQRLATIATVDFATIEESVEISDEEIVEFYESRPDEFMTPESVDIEYLEIRRDELAANAEIEEAALLQYYDDVSSRYLQDEERQARHILILFGDDEDKANEEATALSARVSAGEPFADLAKQHSNDGATSNNGGDLGLLPQSQMPETVGDAVFSMREGEIRGPIRSEFGYHIVQLDSIVPGGPLPLEQVRAEVERELRDRNAEVAFRDAENNISNALFEALDMPAMAAAAGLELQTATGFMRSGGEPFGSNQAVIDAVFEENTLESGEITDIIEIDANRSAVIRVARYQAAERRPLDDVRPQITGALKAAEAQQQVADRAATFVERLDAGDDMATVAADLGASVAAPAVMTRQDATVDAQLRADVFSSKRPTEGTTRNGATATASGDFAIYSLAAVIPGRPESIPLADRDSRKQELATQAGSADLNAFVYELQNRAEIVKSEDITQSEESF